jgi:glycosyltransferase involved in cell wall biosynthesis
MKVLHVLGELQASGAETMLRAAAPVFREQGANAAILSTGEKVGEYSTELEKAGYLIEHIPFQKSPGFFLKFISLLQSNNYDVVHLHTERAHFWLGMTTLVSGRSRVIRTIHSNFSFDGMLRITRGWQRRILSRFGVRHISISKGVEENESRRFHLNTTLIPNWYDDRRFSPPDETQRNLSRQALGITDQTRVLLSVGNCSPVKNHASLLKALAGIPEQTRPLYLHVGAEESHHPERELVEQLGIGERVRFLGHQTDILPYLHAADLYVMPSLYEGFGIAALEALACGLPALFTDVPGLEQFRGKFPATLFVDSDHESIRSGLNFYLSQEAVGWLEQARIHADTARRLFGMSTSVKRYAQLYGIHDY